ncbi:DUF3748 domain-containing protein [Ruficoccus amylovorans]|uniref:DUF3748 domain-containing protein n=2 Tax=Ruficoccus amylovorans TaxID=1804625 RepID=A0A842HKB3_9BACT|nr:DUF3748 domain-containing protein [Ruficoccus amylovorans]
MLSLIFVLCSGVVISPVVFAFHASPESGDGATSFPVETQLTAGPEGHRISNSNVWSPDSQWIVYDGRTGEDFNGSDIRRVNIETSGVQTLYSSPEGSHCGASFYHPRADYVTFILSPKGPDPEWTYAASRRRGGLVDVRSPGECRSLDAMDYSAPFTPGALRGGSHVHVFSGDGQLVSFTYEDEILRQLDGREGAPPSQRNIGVLFPAGPVEVSPDHPHNSDGDYFSVQISETVAAPVPGSDEISRACENGWVGTGGYLKPDGTRQAYAVAFKGLVTAPDGTRHYEVFITDIPEGLVPEARPGTPLEGTLTQPPSPPRGIGQRRLTFTAGREYPGLQGPRHWLLSSPDGSQIAFLMKDQDGLPQLFSISPNGGEPRQISESPFGVSSAFSWSPDGRFIACARDNSIFITEVATGEDRRLTARSPDETAPLPYACVFSPDGRHIAYERLDADGNEQIYIVSVPGASGD